MAVATFLGIASVIWVIMLVVYVISIYPYYRLGLKAGISWSWVAFIPYGSAFITAKIVDWPLWWLWPVLLLLASVLHVFGGLIALALLIVYLVMLAQMLDQFRAGWGWIFINLIPIIGSVIFFIVLYVVALGSQYTYHPRRY